jgi:hypothetical protein
MENRLNKTTYRYIKTFQTPYGCIALNKRQLKFVNYFYKVYGKLDKRTNKYKIAYKKFIKDRLYLQARRTYYGR